MLTNLGCTGFRVGTAFTIILKGHAVVLSARPLAVLAFGAALFRSGLRTRLALSMLTNFRGTDFRISTALAIIFERFALVIHLRFVPSAVFAFGASIFRSSLRTRLASSMLAFLGGTDFRVGTALTSIFQCNALVEANNPFAVLAVGAALSRASFGAPIASTWSWHPSEELGPIRAALGSTYDIFPTTLARLFERCTFLIPKPPLAILAIITTLFGASSGAFTEDDVSNKVDYNCGKKNGCNSCFNRMGYERSFDETLVVLSAF
mmetsp:Transcript_33248/g.69920  ORF Transcript_33248/g.69920 Transcript_33248/m.69920 type:complete len:264 (-) Transcript_33248:195-986(-)